MSSSHVVFVCLLPGKACDLPTLKKITTLMCYISVIIYPKQELRPEAAILSLYSNPCVCVCVCVRVRVRVRVCVCLLLEVE